MYKETNNKPGTASHIETFGSKKKKVRLMFRKKNDSSKGNCCVFSTSKQRIKVCSVYLECKLRQDSYV